MGSLLEAVSDPDYQRGMREKEQLRQLAKRHPDLTAELGLSSMELKIYNYIRMRGQATTSDIRRDIHVKQQTSQKPLASLRQKGYLVRNINGGAPYVYRVKES